MDKDEIKTAVVIPCFNEENAIGKVVTDIKLHLPGAEIHVFDNCSTDATVKKASTAGAEIHSVIKRGKGNVVQAMFRDVDADIYLMLDGDGTYPLAEAKKLIDAAVAQSADMVIGCRMDSYSSSKSRKGHLLGNILITKTLNYLFDADVKDLLSGYRAMSRRFVKSVPLFSRGFEIETELTIHAIEVGAKIIEIPIQYGSRLSGDASKLNTFRDGWKILNQIFSLYVGNRPKVVFGFLAVLFIFLGLVAGIPVVVEYIETGLVPRFPTAILASGLMVLGFLCGFSGLILNAISKTRLEVKKMTFLTIP